jgi:hypothetical protein
VFGRRFVGRVRTRAGVDFLDEVCVFPLSRISSRTRAMSSVAMRCCRYRRSTQVESSTRRPPTNRYEISPTVSFSTIASQRPCSTSLAMSRSQPDWILVQVGVGLMRRRDPLAALEHQARRAQGLRMVGQSLLSHYEIQAGGRDPRRLQDRFGETTGRTPPHVAAAQLTVRNTIPGQIPARADPHRGLSRWPPRHGGGRGQ